MLRQHKFAKRLIESVLAKSAGRCSFTFETIFGQNVPSELVADRKEFKTLTFALAEFLSALNRVQSVTLREQGYWGRKNKRPMGCSPLTADAKIASLDLRLFLRVIHEDCRESNEGLRLALQKNVVQNAS
jgi:hypothetical protein